MDRDEIRRWSKAYDANLPGDARTEKRLSVSIQKKGYVTKKELSDIMRWKFAGDNQKLPRQLRAVAKTEGKQILELTTTALAGGASVSEIGRVGILDGLPGVGPKVASVIVTLWDPKMYGVYDFHCWKALAEEGLVKSEHEETAEEYIGEYLPALREVAAREGMSVREVEKAYYWKHASPKSGTLKPSGESGSSDMQDY